MVDSAVFNLNFLDEASASLHRGVWSVAKGSTRGNIAVIRNHEWPGYTAYHRCDSKVFGTVYMGDGLRNNELNF